MKNLIYISILSIFLFTSCNKEKKTVIKKDIAVNTDQTIYQSKGYKLMEQKCFICHFPKPDPSKRGQMIAPPMLRVQEHYKPSHPKKEDFVNAIKTWVNNPTEDKVQMPGAVRKFNIMPKLAYSDEDIKLIAEVLYDIDFGISPKMHNNNNNNNNNNQELQLNNGKKWQLNKAAISKINNINEKLTNFKSDDITEYQNFGKEVFNTAKTILLNKSISGEKLEQLQAFFHNTEENMHDLIKTETIEEGQKQQIILKKKFNKFLEFFE